MQLSKEDVEAFAILYEKEVGRKIDAATAERLARRLLALVKFSFPRKTEKDPDSDRGP